MDAIQQAHLLKEELDGLRPISRENEMRIMQKFRLDWNYHSNNLEGNSLTYGETKALILFGLTAQGKPFKDHLEMTGHNEAVEWIEEIVKEELPLTQAFIRELHTLLLKEPYQVDAITPTGEPTKKWVVVGDYKKTPNHVQTKTGEIFRFATVEETPAKMTDLIDWFQAEKEKEEYSAISTAIEFHYRFIRIHPFDDGNGRTARILMNFILMQSGYPPVIIKTGEKQEYIATLEQADAGLFEPFINYIAENLGKSLELMIKGAKGESVEEENDIDKEIALLDSKLKKFGASRNDSVKSIYEFCEKYLAGLYDEFLDSFNSLSKFFENISYHIKESNKTRMWTIFNPRDESTMKRIFKSFLDSHTSPDTFEFTVLLDNLKYLMFDKESISISLRSNFEEQSVLLETEKFSKRLFYNEEVTKDVFQELSKSVQREVLDKINALTEKIRKVDTP